MNMNVGDLRVADDSDFDRLKVTLNCFRISMVGQSFKTVLFGFHLVHTIPANKIIRNICKINYRIPRIVLLKMIKCFFGTIFSLIPKNIFSWFQLVFQIILRRVIRYSLNQWENVSFGEI